jgi:hypothetical protein
MANGQQQQTAAVLGPMEAHYRAVVRGLAKGRVVPLLGAGANLCDRSADDRPGPWSPGPQLPSGAELAKWLSQEFDYPSPDTWNLARVSQYIDAIDGDGPLYESLREAFTTECHPTSLHQLLAHLPSMLAEQCGRPRYQPSASTTHRSRSTWSCISRRGATADTSSTYRPPASRD